MIVMSVVALVVCFVLFEVLYVKYSGSAVPAPTIARSTQTIGTGPNLTYVVMGDSTAIAQGGNYAQGYAEASAQHLAKHNTVHWKNLAVSGARANDVLATQIPQAVAMHPDVALIAVGANDVTHATSPSSVRESLEGAIAGLRHANPAIKVVLTGSPDMGSVPRFAQPVRWYAGVRTQQLNKTIEAMATQLHVTFAPVASQTGPTFRKHPELFAADKFHPTDAGYKLWIPVINTALDTAR